MLHCCRSYQLERAAAEVRASSMFGGATACIVPGIGALGVQHSQLVAKRAGALEGSSGVGAGNDLVSSWCSNINCSHHKPSLYKPACPCASGGAASAD
jgi:hypothetical protein